MKTPIHYIQHSDEIPLSSFSDPTLSLQEEWYGNTLKSPIGFHFILANEHLYFFAQQKDFRPLTPPDAKEGMFTADLWKCDTVEFFISYPEGGCYYEFNLSPCGAWWMAEFVGKREASEGYKVPEKLETYHEVTPQGWKASAKIPLSYFSKIPQELFFKENAELFVATCAITETPEQLFLTTSPHSGIPDFHCVSDYEPYTLISDCQ